MDLLNKRPYTFDRVVRIFFTVIAVIGVIYLINRLKGALLPFLVAWLIAYLIHPYVQFIQRRLKVRNRMAAIFCALLSIAGALYLLCLVFLPAILTEMEKVGVVIQKFLTHTDHSASLPESITLFIQNNIDPEQIKALFSNKEWLKTLEELIAKAWTLITGSVSQIITIVSWFIVLLYLVFILLDYEKIIIGFRQLIPSVYRPVVLTIMSDLEISMNRYFRGQSLIAFLVGILFCIGFLIIGLPLAIPLGLFIGLLNMVPYLQIAGVFPTILLCLLKASESGMNFWIIFALAMVVFSVVQIIQDGFLTPRIMGKVTGLNPAIILLSLSIWGSLMGMIGMIIALPLTTLMLSYYQHYILDRAEATLSENKTPAKSLDKEIEKE